MDLAKIRKKSLLLQTDTFAEDFSSGMNSPASIKNSQEIIHTLPVLSGGEFFQKESYSAPVVSTLAAPSLIVETSVNSMRTPLEAILAGRVAAGCDDESSIAADVTTELIAESHLEFLCFRVYDEIYGINIMDIKEIIKLREVTEVPRAPFFVLGVLSLRGTIIPVIDMRIRLGLPSEKSTGKERIIVIKNNNSFSGLQVDEVIKVVQVPLSAVEAAPSILDGIDREFISGLGRCDGRLIIILNLENIADINMY